MRLIEFLNPTQFVKHAASLRRPALAAMNTEFGQIGAISHNASKTINAREKISIPMYHFGNIFFFEKNRKAINIHVMTMPPFIIISPNRIGAQSGL